MDLRKIMSSIEEGRGFESWKDKVSYNSFWVVKRGYEGGGWWVVCLLCCRNVQGI